MTSVVIGIVIALGISIIIVGIGCIILVMGIDSIEQKPSKKTTKKSKNK